MDPSLKKGPFTTDEEIALENAYEELGNRWTEISKRLPGRSEHEVKARWKTMHPNRQDKSQARSFGVNFSLKAALNRPTIPFSRKRTSELSNDRYFQEMNPASHAYVGSVMDDVGIETSAKRPYVEDDRRLRQEWNHHESAVSIQLTNSFLATLKNCANDESLEDSQLVDSLFASFGPNDEESIRRQFQLSEQELDEILNSRNIKKTLSTLSLLSINSTDTSGRILNNDSIISNSSFLTDEDDVQTIITCFDSPR